jgi:hypothetical protein
MIRAGRHKRRKRAATIAIAAVLAVGATWPVHGYFQAHSFFHAAENYRQWFQNTVWLENTRFEERRLGITKPGIDPPMAVKYPWKERKFVMTEEKWQVSSVAVEQGTADWYDIEIVRQRAEMDEHPSAMDFLGWMYEKGQGVDRDYRKAYMWYERAKLAGEKKTRGTPFKIFQRLSPQDKFMSQVQLAEDTERARGPKSRRTFDAVNLRVLEQERGGLLTDTEGAAALASRVRNQR